MGLTARWGTCSLLVSKLRQVQALQVRDGQCGAPPVSRDCVSTFHRNERLCNPVLAPPHRGLGDGRSRRAGEAQRNYARGADQGERSRNAGSPSRTSPRASIPASPKIASWITGSSLSKTSHGNFRAWLLLAPPCTLPQGDDTEVLYSVLGGKIHWERRPRQTLPSTPS